MKVQYFISNFWGRRFSNREIGEGRRKIGRSGGKITK